VDDLCGCAVDDRTTQPSPNFIIFFDFSQLMPQGREVALREAERWAREVKRPEDRAMAVAYSTEAGLRQLCPLTDDGGRLVEAFRDAATDPELADPFPAKFAERLERCTSGTTSCHNSGAREYWQTYQSSKVLLHFLTRMNAFAGRKALLLFYQNNAVYPARLYSADANGHTFYDGEPTDSVPSLDHTIGELAGTAVASGTVIYPIMSGIARDWSLDFGEALANFTGGRFNREVAEIPDVIDVAGRGCACMYRIGVDPPPSAASRVLRVKVAVGDENWLPHNYRLLQLTKQDRWRRNAGAVLLDPESSKDIGLSAAILPVSTTTKRWDLKLQVALDPRSLGLLPHGTKRVASWEIGAVLVKQGGRGGVEMLGVSRVTCPEEGCATTVVHERVIEGLRPGTYELRAFAHDRWTDVYGGAKAKLELPRPGRPSAVGPLLVAESGKYISADLPLRSKNSRPDESMGVHSSVGVHPLGEHDEPVAVLSWICGKKKMEAQPVTTRRLSFEGAEVSALEAATLERIGHCWAVQDTVDTSRLTPGQYDYELVWEETSGLAAAPLRASFEVAGVEPRSFPLETPVAQSKAIPPEPTPAATIERPLEPSEVSTELQPSTVELHELLVELAEEADWHRDTALRFACDETIVENKWGRRRTLEFEYIYAYNKAGLLRDYRLTRRGSKKVRKGKTVPVPVDLASTHLPAFVLRAYSSIFIFDRNHQHLYDFEILGEEETLGRRAVKVRFEAVPPYVEDLNDWFGAAWVDLETHQLLRVRALRAEDHATKLMFDKGIVQETMPGPHRPHSFDQMEVEFAVEQEGIRFPSRVTLERTGFETSTAAPHLRTSAHEQFRIVQSYDNYRIFGVRTAESIDRVVEE